MFASRITNTVTLPSDPGVTVTVRKLSWLQKQDARKVNQHASSRDLVQMGGAEFMRIIREMEQPQAVGESDAPTDRTVVEAAPVEPAAVVPSDPVDLAMATHDLFTVLICGVKAWSVPEPVNKETLADLEPEDAEFLAREILRLSVPAGQFEADRKNAESPCIGSSRM